jgi:UDP-N-acetylglucosamine--N-acetylmuramyl-(pentapeptide) pyrophosphoryl-undecaprenol N-acetylglucosamine transferase
VLESELANLEDVIGEAFANMDDMKQSAITYGEEVLKSSDKIAKIICTSSKAK